MNAGIVFLVLGYVLSQFYRAFLAVLTPILGADLGATPEDLATASGVWFLFFASMQIPVGEALDRIGPRRTMSVLFAVGGAGGAALFAMANSPVHIVIAMGLIGMGCAPVLMATYYIFARSYTPAMFATLAGITLGIGTFGNIASALPLTLAVEWFGWRGSLAALSVISLVVAIACFLLVRDPERVQSEAKGSVLDLLRLPFLWPIFAMMAVNYVPAAGLRGLWAGPYLDEVFGATAQTIGVATLLMSIAMAIGNFIFGPLDQVFRSRKAIVLVGNLLGAGVMGALVVFAGHSVLVSTILMIALGLTAATFVVIIAHAKEFFPEHLTGRGVTLLNLFGMGGAGLFQSLSGRLYSSVEASGDSVYVYQCVFGFFGSALLIGCVIYAFSKEK